MKNRKLRTKITMRVGILLILGGVILNIVVKNIIDYSSNNTIKNDMTIQQNNSTEFINQYFMINGKTLDKQTFISNSPMIAMKLSEYDNSTIGIYDVNGELQYQSVNGEVNKSINKHIEQAKNNKAYIYFTQENNEYKGYFAYPFYFNEEFLGIVEIVRDYKEIVTNNRNIYLLFTLVESFFFLIILILTYLIMRKSTRPIENLLNGVKEISKGNYGYEVLEHTNKDEISDLAYEYNKMRKKIKKQIELTHHLEKNRRDFFCNITHELKTPLTSISGYAELLQSNFDNEKFRKQAISSIEEESAKLNSMISSILEVSRDEMGMADRAEYTVLNYKDNKKYTVESRDSMAALRSKLDLTEKNIYIQELDKITKLNLETGEKSSMKLSVPHIINVFEDGMLFVECIEENEKGSNKEKQYKVDFDKKEVTKYEESFGGKNLSIEVVDFKNKFVGYTYIEHRKDIEQSVAMYGKLEGDKFIVKDKLFKNNEEKECNARGNFIFSPDHNKFIAGVVTTSEENSSKGPQILKDDEYLFELE